FVEDSPQPTSLPTAKDWQYGYGRYDEEAKAVAGFTPLPHFSGTAWSGGPSWPDAKLGWVQLTATGGHPGNDRLHAAVRRWIAPRAMTVKITSRVTNEPEQGDGIRAFIVQSKQGLLGQTKVHHSSADLNVETAVAAGEIIDFVVDIDEVLNSDQFLWKIVLAESGEMGTVWNAEADFPVNTVETLTPWEQLAQVLLCTNEFLFVD
ncbi:MAG: hypothetical protein KDA80_01540, partial [Planctomycetaceae bacterium]|nr:hypothetical protein [Planctomycetaceae bacterium]